MKKIAEFQSKKSAVMVGEVAEYVRSYFAKHDAKPPGLQTSVNPDGSMSIIADNPDVGLQLQVIVAPLHVFPQSPQLPSAPAASPAPQGIGPPPPPVDQPILPGAPVQSLGPNPGIGPLP